MSPQMQGASLSSCFQIFFGVVLSRMNLPKQVPGVERVRLCRNVIGEKNQSFRELTMLHHSAGLFEFGVVAPGKFIFNRLVSFLFDAGMLDCQGGQCAKQKSAYVRPVRHSAGGTEQRSVKNFAEQPER